LRLSENTGLAQVPLAGKVLPIHNFKDAREGENSAGAAAKDFQF
jgi:hypothetical protein